MSSPLTTRETGNQSKPSPQRWLHRRGAIYTSNPVPHWLNSAHLPRMESFPQPCEGRLFPFPSCVPQNQGGNRYPARHRQTRHSLLASPSHSFHVLKDISTFSIISFIHFSAASILLFSSKRNFNPEFLFLVVLDSLLISLRSIFASCRCVSPSPMPITSAFSPSRFLLLFQRGQPFQTLIKDAKQFVNICLHMQRKASFGEMISFWVFWDLSLALTDLFS